MKNLGQDRVAPAIMLCPVQRGLFYRLVSALEMLGRSEPGLLMVAAEGETCWRLRDVRIQNPCVNYFLYQGVGCHYEPMTSEGRSAAYVLERYLPRLLAWAAEQFGYGMSRHSLVLMADGAAFLVAHSGSVAELSDGTTFLGDEVGWAPILSDVPPPGFALQSLIRERSLVKASFNLAFSAWSESRYVGDEAGFESAAGLPVIRETDQTGWLDEFLPVSQVVEVENFRARRAQALEEMRMIDPPPVLSNVVVMSDWRRLRMPESPE